MDLSLRKLQHTHRRIDHLAFQPILPRRYHQQQNQQECQHRTYPPEYPSPPLRQKYQRNFQQVTQQTHNAQHLLLLPILPLIPPHNLPFNHLLNRLHFLLLNPPCSRHPSPRSPQDSQLQHHHTFFNPPHNRHQSHPYHEHLQDQQ